MSDRKQLALNKARRAYAMRPKTLCLVMIVRNESKIITRLLDSVKSVIDMVSITDTGSTDNTQKIIKNWGKTNKIPTTVHNCTFLNFGYNRTESVKLANLAYANADYFLLSDADFEWDIDGITKFDKRMLMEDMYLVLQTNEHINYWNTRILKSKTDFKCHGRTHEFWGYLDENIFSNSSKVSTLKIIDHEDGGCKDDKFKRDLKLLQEDIDDPNTSQMIKTRAHFYLAQTHADIGNNLDAIEWYLKRIKLGGFPEEVYYSWLRCGLASQEHYYHLRNKTDFDKKTDSEKNEMRKYFDLTVKYYRTAHKVRPTRAESLANLAKFYRDNSMNQESYDVCLIGEKIEYPKNDSLFINYRAYNYLFDFEKHIVCDYINKHEEGKEALQRLLSRDDLFPFEIETVTNNCKFYI